MNRETFEKTITEMSKAISKQVGCQAVKEMGEKTETKQVSVSLPQLLWAGLKSIEGLSLDELITECFIEKLVADEQGFKNLLAVSIAKVVSSTP